jgi:3-aminobutyryl-CoA ammonia-lyase
MLLAFFRVFVHNDSKNLTNVRQNTNDDQEKVMKQTEQYISTLRVRVSAHDAHYGGQLVNGAYLLSLFGDVATELAILCDGDEGLLAGYERVELLAPIFAGDFVEATGRITRIGRTSRRVEFEAYKIIAARTDINDSAADVLEPPVLVGKAIGTTVIKADRQRKVHTAA